MKICICWWKVAETFCCVVCGNNNSCLLSDRGGGGKGDWGWRAEFCGLAIGIKNFDTLYETQQTTQQQQEQQQRKRQRQTKTTQRALDIFGLRRWQTAKLPRPPLAQDRTTKLAEVGVPFLASPVTKSTFIMLFLAEPQLNSIFANECAHQIRARQRRSPSKNTNK